MFILQNCVSTGLARLADDQPIQLKSNMLCMLWQMPCGRTAAWFQKLTLMKLPM